MDWLESSRDNINKHAWWDCLMDFGLFRGSSPNNSACIFFIFWSLVQPVSDFQPALNDVKFPAPQIEEVLTSPPNKKRTEGNFRTWKNMLDCMKWCDVQWSNLPPFFSHAKIQGFLISISANNSWVPTLELSTILIKDFFMIFPQLLWICATFMWRTQTNQMQWWDISPCTFCA